MRTWPALPVAAFSMVAADAWASPHFSMTIKGGDVALRTGARPRLLPDSNVCVLVEVDQRVYSIPITGSHRFGFSAALVGRLMQLDAVERGFADGIAPNNDRFVINLPGRARNCRDGSDIHIALRYLPRGDGGRFRVEYEIRQGMTVLTGQDERQLERELSSGSLPYTREDSPFEAAISDDIRNRARIFLDAIRY